MNAKRKEKAVKEFAMFAEDELLSEKLIEAGYDPEKEIPEIIEAIKTRAQGGVKFDLLDLFSEEDEDGRTVYTESENWKEYQKEAAKLSGNVLTDYLKVNAVGCFRKKLNSDAVAVQYMVGLRLIKEKPLAKTRIEVASAVRMNAQIWNTNNHPESSVYYLVESLINY
jgi:hypothetical protein